MKKFMAMLLLAAMCLAFGSGAAFATWNTDAVAPETAAHNGYYKQCEVKVEVRGIGQFTMEQIPSKEYTQTISIGSGGQGFFTCTFNEPGNYKFRVYSNQPSQQQQDKYIVDICVYQSTRAEDELYAVVAITNEANNVKITPSVINYQPTPTPTPAPGQTTTQGGGAYGKGDSVKTGDSNELVWFVSVLAVSAMLTGVIVSRKQFGED